MGPRAFGAGRRVTGVKDRNRVQFWRVEPFPAGAAVWPKMVGWLTGYGESHYRFHPDYFCPHLVIRGRGNVRTRHGQWAVGPGDMFTLWPGEAIEYAEDPAAPWEFYWLHLHGPGTPEYVRACGFLPERPVLQPQNAVSTLALFRRIYRACAARRPGDACRVVSWLYRLVGACAIARAKQLPVRDHREDLVAKATAALESLLHTAPNINGLADMLGTSRATLFRAFRERLGVTPVAYLAGVRIRRACDLLKGTSQPLAAVARAAGFRGTKYFLRCFHAATGTTPAAYRRAAV